MREKQLLYFGGELLATALNLAFLMQGQVEVSLVLTGLCFCCIIAGKLLVKKIGKPRRLDVLLAAGCAAACFWLGPEKLFALFLVLLIELVDLCAGYRSLLPFSCVLFALAWLLFPCGLALGAITFALVCALLFARLLIERLNRCRKLLNRQREENKALSERLSDNRRLLKTLQYAARLEERNRLASRIHDKIGHGVSGSIILLEAAMLSMERDPAGAKGTVDRAVANLRESVDDIRLSLRSERPTRSEAGLSEIKVELARFSDAHPVRTSLDISGRTEEIPGYLWNCIYENLLEALTNLLKHSDATAFSLSLSAANKIARVEFKDNGRAPSHFEQGMGLDAIEERTVVNGGRCFVESGPTGFLIRQIFTLE